MCPSHSVAVAKACREMAASKAQLMLARRSGRPRMHSVAAAILAARWRRTLAQLMMAGRFWRRWSLARMHSVAAAGWRMIQCAAWRWPCLPRAICERMHSPSCHVAWAVLVQAQMHGAAAVMACRETAIVDRLSMARHLGRRRRALGCTASWQHYLPRDGCVRKRSS